MIKDSSEVVLRAPMSLRIALWVAQFLVFAIFEWAGFMKLTQPIADLSKLMIWTGEFPTPFVRIIGLIDITGGIGMILPALTRVKPKVGLWAAIGCCVLQVFAIVFHTARGEASLTPLNYALLALSLFVLWGRSKKAPITAR